MIITGYQGIGKSTLAKNNDKIIDLESASFWKTETNEFGEKVKTRPDDWYVYYCQVAEHLSSQGYTVFVSCHKAVREWLGQNRTEKFCAIFPDFYIKDGWLKRLENRYNNSQSEKDLRAWEHAKKSYDSDIASLYYECSHAVQFYDDAIAIDTFNYDLQKLVESLHT